MTENGYLIDDITKVLDYMWHSERKDYFESGCPNNHVFVTLKRIRNEFGLRDGFAD